MQIHYPKTLNELGGRENNEDSVFPIVNSVTDKDRLFLVCDGVGGHAKGEVASALTCKYFETYISAHSNFASDEDFIGNGLKYVENRLNEYQTRNPESKGMATTLTLLYLLERPQSALVAWVGDSRIYQVRDGKIIFKSKDHSEVQDLINMGEITEEDAKNHPRKNVILRAVSGSEKPTRADKKILSDIRKDDWFFLCTDGVLEQIDDRQIERWFISRKSPTEIKQLILNKCQGKTKDNFSAYIIKIREAKSSSLELPNLDTLGVKRGQHFKDKGPNRISLDRKWSFWLVLILAFLALAAYLVYANSRRIEDNPIENESYQNDSIPKAEMFQQEESPHIEDIQPGPQSTTGIQKDLEEPVKPTKNRMSDDTNAIEKTLRQGNLGPRGDSLKIDSPINQRGPDTIGLQIRVKGKIFLKSNSH